MPSSLCCGPVNVRKWRVIGRLQPSFTAALIQVSSLTWLPLRVLFLFIFKAFFEVVHKRQMGCAKCVVNNRRKKIQWISSVRKRTNWVGKIWRRICMDIFLMDSRHCSWPGHRACNSFHALPQGPPFKITGMKSSPCSTLLSYTKLCNWVLGVLYGCLWTSQFLILFGCIWEESITWKCRIKVGSYPKMYS